jgi:hypothetical protein
MAAIMSECGVDSVVDCHPDVIGPMGIGCGVGGEPRVSANAFGGHGGCP